MKNIFLLSMLVISLISCVPHTDNISVVVSTPLPTITNIPTTVSTPTYEPFTIPSVETQKRFYEFLAQNGNCELPCLWGVTPGETLAEDAFAAINEFSSMPEFSYYSLGNQLHYSNTVVVGYYEYLDSTLYIDVSDDGIVRGFSISTYSSANGYSIPLKQEHFEKFSLLYVLKHLGLPDAIYMDPPKAPRIKDAYSIYVLYDHEKIFLEYYGTADEIFDGIYEICPNLGDKDIFDLHVVAADPYDTQIDLIPYSIRNLELGITYPANELSSRSK